MKTNAIIRIIVFSIVILALLGILIAGLTLDSIEWHWDSSMADGNVESQGSVAASQINALEVEWVSGSVTIQPSETDTITFSETTGLDSEYQLIWKQSGDKLIIQFQKPRVYFGFSFGIDGKMSKDLVINVPSDWIAREITIESVSADLEFTELKAQKLDLNSVSGKSELKDCVISDLTVETVSGRVNYSGSASTISLDSVSADCEFDLTKGTKRITSECVSGNLTLYFPEDQGFTVELDGLSQRLSTDFPTIKTDDEYRYGDESCRIDGECVSGSFKILKSTEE